MAGMLFKNNAFTVRYLASFGLFAVFQGLALMSLFHEVEEISIGVYFADGAISALCYAMAGILLGYAIKFGCYPGIPRYQRVINHVVYALIYCAVSVGGAIGLLALTSHGEFVPYQIPSIPFRAINALMIYLILDRFYRSSLEQTQLENEVRATFEETVASQHKHETGDTETAPTETEIVDRIVVKAGPKIELIQVADIISILADGDYVTIKTMSGKYLKEQTMKYFEEHLPKDTFLRIHRSAIVNITAITGIELYEKQQQVVTLRNGQKVKSSQEGYRNLKAKLHI